jgi:hypothetical protein
MARARDYYESLIASTPAGAERAVLRVLSFHIGPDAAIQKPDAMSECAKIGAHFSDERQFRLTVVKLRKRGIPVCASSGDSGYFLPSSMAEYQEFRGREYIKKIVDMRETVTAMDTSVKQMFAAEYQKYQQEKSAKAGQPSLL